MTQELKVKKMINGKEQLVTVEVLRSWSESSGRHIFLHMGGLYGYKNGNPVKGMGELDVIPEGVHREAAKSWWRRLGKKLSEDFYAKEEEKSRVLAGDFSEEESPDSADLDNILYARYAADEKRPENVEPCPWTEFFKERPDWWGQANSLSFNDWIYEKLDQSKKPPEAEVVEQKTETSENSKNVPSQGSVQGDAGSESKDVKDKEF